jgi:hypothetical protein
MRHNAEKKDATRNTLYDRTLVVAELTDSLATIDAQHSLKLGIKLKALGTLDEDI